MYSSAKTPKKNMFWFSVLINPVDMHIDIYVQTNWFAVHAGKHSVA